MILLGVAGAARAGKDTTAKMIQAFVPNTVTMAFAYAVKEEADPICRERWGISGFTEDPEEKKIIRQLLIDIGHGKRQGNPTIWIDKLADRIDATLPTKNIVVTDVRYANEAEMIHRKEGLVVYVERDTQNNSIPSEQESLPLIKWDVKINTGSADTVSLVRQVFPDFKI